MYGIKDQLLYTFTLNAAALSMWALTFLSILYVLWFISLEKDDLEIIHDRVLIPAQVTESFDLDLVNGKAGKIVEFEYKTQEGKYIVSAAEARDPSEYARDQLIHIYYDPSHPAHADIQDEILSHLEMVRSRYKSAFITFLLFMALALYFAHIGRRL